MTKTCSKCGVEKDISDFQKCKSNKDGLQRKCKGCRKIENRENYDKEKIKIKNKNYYNNNKENIIEKSLNYQKLEERKTYKKKWYNDNLVKIKKYRIDNKERSLCNGYRLIDKKKGLVCDLTIDWIKENITSKECIYCGETDNLGCDRIDNTLGHTMKNCVPCCPTCNRMRMNKSQQEFIESVRKIYKWQMTLKLL